ncbi:MULTISPECIES: RDD family protein [Halococcus]|uniref:RDD domain-containing protein n=1 Tax=Halococcus salifodinae DSM 8989 TaxID=1227456 RepID=M0N4Z7_9EURY|nr:MULTISPECIES: RDD family protein [Halococcus]EMA52194.1 RDD domain-containing protein [Halococcus salifodinae DSM 8989]
MAGYPTPPTRDDTSVVGARIGAQIVDQIITAIMFAIMFFGIVGLGGAMGGNAGAVISAIIFLIGSAAIIFYWFLLEGFWDGYTIGKKLFGIKVVEEDGSPCSLSSSVVRNLLYIIDSLFYFLIGFIAMSATDKRQRIGDRLGNTVVVHETPRNNDRPEDASADRTTAP